MPLFGDISIDKYDALRYLGKNKLMNKGYLKFIKESTNKNKLDLKEKIEAIHLMDFSRKLLTESYLKFGQSDTRYIRGKIKESWNLAYYPQAVSMAVIRHGNKVLLMKKNTE